MIRQRQDIISLPDVSEMAVTIKVHESYADKVKVGQKSLITVDAFPNQTLDGEVSRVAVLPDSTSRWLNPDLKVYMTDVAIRGEHALDLKPGMSAKVEVIVADLQDVVYVPIQAVVPRGDGRACYVMTPSGPQRRMVEAGLFNDRFIEIKAGLEEGENVMLNPPGGVGDEAISGRKRPSKDRENEEAERAEPGGERRPRAESGESEPAAAPSQETQDAAGDGAPRRPRRPGGGERGGRRRGEAQPAPAETPAPANPAPATGAETPAPAAGSAPAAAPAQPVPAPQPAPAPPR